MYDFFYEMDGLIKVGNCALAKNTCNRNHLYEVGSILYIRAKALIGVLEKVYIKKNSFLIICIGIHAGSIVAAISGCKSSQFKLGCTK